MAMERQPSRAEECSAAILATDALGSLLIGTAVAVRIGERVLLATAAHNLVTGAFRRRLGLRVVPRGRYRADPVRVIGVGVAVGSGAADVGWIEVDGAAARRAGLACLSVGQLGVEGPEASRLEVVGFPAAGVDRGRIAGTRFALDRGLLRGRVVDPEVGAVGYRAGQDLALAAGMAAAPRGFSGGGVWSISGRRRVVALARSWNQRRGLLFCTRIEHWLDLVRADFPDSGL